MFERFTAGARAIVVSAQDHARRLGHGSVGTEHLLLALCSTDQPVGEVFRGGEVGLTPDTVEGEVVRLVAAPLEQDRSALAALGIDLDRVLATAEANHGPGALAATVTVRSRRRLRRRRHRQETSTTWRHIPFSPRTKRSLELSLREALRLKHNFIGPEHIALGVLREGQGLACQFITERGIPLDTLRVALEESLRQ